MNNEQSESVTYNNSNYVGGSALQIRLDATELINNFKLNLSGKAYENFMKEDGTVGTRLVSVGEPRANELGVQALGSFVSNYINPQIVQGNFDDEEMYFLMVDDMEDSVRNKLIINSPKWGIPDEEIQGIYDELKSTITIFLTRALHNKERESYSDTIRTNENNTIQKSKAFDIFNQN